MKNLLCVPLLCLVLIAAATLGRAQETKGFRHDMIGQFSYVQKQIMDLENAIPDGKMNWRPSKEVRSIREVYSHIAFANYFFGKLAGASLPEGISIASPDDEKKWDKTLTDRKAIREQLVKSFDFVRSAISNMSDASLETEVDFFGQKMTLRNILLTELSHTHEHLGQSVAYARMVGVVPPWTAAQMAAAKSKQ